MKKSFVTLITLLLLATIPAGASAEETVTEEYGGPLGANVLGHGLGLILFPNQDGHQYTSVKPLGGAILFSERRWSNVIITIEDAVYGADAGASGCLHNPITEAPCDERGLIAEAGCGSVSLLNAPFESDRAVFFIYTIVVTDELVTCGGSQGSGTGLFT